VAVEDIVLESEEITLGQFLKFASIIDSGGMTKWFLSEHDIKVNGEPENRRGKKLHAGDRIDIKDIGSYRLVRD